jgi:hypothetical protein
LQILSGVVVEAMIDVTGIDQIVTLAPAQIQAVPIDHLLSRALLPEQIAGTPHFPNRL